MKRLVAVFGFMAMLCSSTIFANGDNNYPGFLTSFFKQFKNAQKVSWTKLDGLTRISFEMGDKTSFAYYNETNELVVVTTPSSLTALPKSVQSKLISQYKNFKVLSVFECVKDNKSSYVAVLENGKKQLIVSSTGNKWRILGGDAR